MVLIKLSQGREICITKKHCNRSHQITKREGGNAHTSGKSRIIVVYYNKTKNGRKCVMCSV